MPELTLICAWCNTTMRQGDPARRPTHGICEACTCLALAELDAPNSPAPEPHLQTSPHATTRAA